MSSAHEQWRDVPGYEGLYQVSDHGRVYSVRSSRLMVFSPNKRGYLSVVLHTSNVPKRRYVHRLVALAFLDNPENLPDVNHKDGDKTNNTLENLEWASRHENMLHARQVLKRWQGPAKKPVLCLETGKVYDCALSAAQDVGVSRSSVNLACLGRDKVFKNLHFKYIEEEQNYGN